jgi:FtsP/CotA-like multicopper oxidase with cupredoxin domain
MSSLSCLECVDLQSHSFQGTFWYHSHFSNQYCDGLRGAFVVRDPQDPQAGLYDVDDGVS